MSSYWLQFSATLVLLFFCTHLIKLGAFENKTELLLISLESYFNTFRKNIVGIDQSFESPYGQKEIVYADWTASGRLYKPIEKKLVKDFGPFVGNTHSDSSETGTSMTQAYYTAHDIIKEHVNADKNDVIINTGFGMTAAVNKFQRILGLKVPERCQPTVCNKTSETPVIFISHMEHHSNHTSWLHTIADVVVVKPTKEGLIDFNDLENQLKKHSDRTIKIASVSACSNVTGIQPDYYQFARLMHEHGGLCFVDFAASAPYVNINMHPENPLEKLDAIFFSPHKFLGGPGSSGVLLFDSTLYDNKIPDHPGGGTVDWTNPWGGHKFISDIEAREDGGTPGFLQAVKAALSIELKKQMSVEKIWNREKELVPYIFSELNKIPQLFILAGNCEKRLGIFSFYIENVHYNLIVKLLNDLYGIQVRGGCSCAGTYGHYLLHVGPNKSKRITEKIDHGDLSEKPGWVRFSIHPTTTNKEIEYILSAIKQTAKDAPKLEKDYIYTPHTNEFHHRKESTKNVKSWFTL
jgi:selenocysteine lyase/cysteine desulfurase